MAHETTQEQNENSSETTSLNVVGTEIQTSPTAEIQNITIKREISTTTPLEKREQMIRLSIAGISNTAIARQLGMARTTVSTILGKFSRTGTVAPEKRGGGFQDTVNPNTKGNGDIMGRR